jgi:hypothetical protein
MTALVAMPRLHNRIILASAEMVRFQKRHDLTQKMPSIGAMWVKIPLALFYSVSVALLTIDAHFTNGELASLNQSCQRVTTPIWRYVWIPSRHLVDVLLSGELVIAQRRIGTHLQRLF